MSKFLKSLNQKRREKQNKEDSLAKREAKQARIKKQHLAKLQPVFEEIASAGLVLKPSSPISQPRRLPTNVDEYRGNGNWRVFVSDYVTLYVRATLRSGDLLPLFQCHEALHGKARNIKQFTKVDDVAAWFADRIIEYEYKPPRVPDEEEPEEEDGRGQRVIELED